MQGIVNDRAYGSRGLYAFRIESTENGRREIRPVFVN
jgi:hypothetical protein